jgi:phosphoribosylformimino-5-aminoimidazole carboxamide ribotide isomerase
MNIIPAIDLKQGACVRLYQGDFAKQTHYSSEPLAVAKGFRESGFRYLHIVDLDGAQSGEQRNRETVRDLVSASGLDVQLGGGLRDRSALVDWFAAGVQRAVIGSLAVTDSAAVREWLQEFGADRFVLALDCRCDNDGTPWLATHGWTKRADVTLWECIDRFVDAGLVHVLCTDVSRDGAMSGPSIDLYREFVARYPQLQLQASGGVRGIADLRELRKLGAAAAISGRALLDGCISNEEIASFQQSA